MNLDAVADAVTSQSAYDLLRLLIQSGPVALAIVVVLLAVTGLLLGRLR